MPKMSVVKIAFGLPANIEDVTFEVKPSIGEGVVRFQKLANRIEMGL